MTKYRIESAAALLCCAALFGNASAQSPDVVRGLNAKYDVVWPADCGLMMVNKGGQRVPDNRLKSNGKYGYVDTLGQVVVPLTYHHASRFCDGYAVVGMRGKADKMLFGLIDRTGRVAVPLEWEHLGDVGNGICVAYSGGDCDRTFALVDTLGNVRKLDFNYCERFSGGLALVGSGSWQEKEGVPGLNLAEKYEFRGKFGYIGPDGRTVIPVQYDDARSFSDDGLAAVGMQGKYYIKWGFIDRSGQLVIPCDFYSVEPFRRDRAVVSKVVAGGKLAYGFIDRSGKEVVPCRFDIVSGFRFPNAWVGMESDGECAYTLIDSNGNSVLPFKVLDLQDGGKFGQAVAAIVDQAGRKRYGIVDNNGKTLLPFEFDQISIFSEWDEAGNRWKEGVMGTKDGENFSFDISKKGE